MGKATLKLGKIELLIALLSVVLFAALSFGSFRIFEIIGKIIYGVEMRLDLPGNVGENRIAIVNIDEKSVKQLGPWPWPRSVIADMIWILKSNGARLIALDLLFSEPERNQGLQEVRDLQRSILLRDGASAKDDWLLESLTKIQERLDNDRFLAATIEESGNVILPVSGTFGKYEAEVVIPEDSALKRSTLPTKKSPEAFHPVNQLLMPFEELARSCDGFGHTNLSPNPVLQGVVHLLYVDYRGHLVPSLGLHLAQDFLARRPDEVLKPGRGIQLGQRLIPAVNGEIFVKFKGGKRSFPYYSFVDILNVKKVPAVFENKIVLIGSTSEGGLVNTPVDVGMPRIELLANVVENLMNERFVKRPESVFTLEILLIVLASFAGAAVLPRLGMANRLAVAAGMLLIVFLIGLFFFIALDTWLKTVYIGFSVVFVFVAVSIRDFVAKARRLDLTSKEGIETNRMLGLSLQGQGLLDLAFDNFRKCPLDDGMKELIYNLGLDYERKRMTNKAVSVYEYILARDPEFRDLGERTVQLKRLIGPFPAGAEVKKEGQIVVSEELGIRPTVGRYEIIGEIGQGAMGIVYKASDPKINRLVAVKTIRFSDEFEPEKVKDVKDRFFREAEMAGKLSHRSIVSIYDVGEDYDLTYMAMEFLEGETLQRYCQRGSLLPLRQVLFVVGETASALEYAHSRGVIHRDVKPGNIMLLKDGRVKVTDFGIAKAVSTSQTKSGVVLGTPNYMSPEQINGDALDGRSDIFSLGVVFFELLTGRLPFEGGSLGNLFYQITQARHPSIRELDPKIPRPCEQIVDRLLSKEPAERFHSAGELARYVRAVAAKIEQVRTKPAVDGQ